MQYDFVAIGDITTDAFIKLKDAEELMNHGTRELCVRFADKVPYEEVVEIRAVGNAANAAVSAQRIGLSSALIARVGDDENGRNCRETLKGNGVSDEYVERQAGLPSRRDSRRITTTSCGSARSARYSSNKQNSPTQCRNLKSRRSTSI